MNRSRKLAFGGLIVGLLSLFSYPLLFAMAPVVPLLIAALAAVPSKTRPFALGALVAAVIGFVVLFVFLALMSSGPPEIERYG